MKYYLCITPFFPSPESFVGPYVLDQVKAIERNSDYKVLVFKPAMPYRKENDYIYDGIKVYRFNNYSLPSNIYPNGLCDRLTARSLLKKLKSIGIDLHDISVCHAHVVRFGAIANIVKHHNPAMLTAVQHHGFDVMSETDGRLARFGWHKRHCISYGVETCNNIDLNICVSKKTLSYVLDKPGIKLNNSYVLYNGVDTHKFFPKKVERQRDAFVIGCVANFWKLKDQMTLIKAVEALTQSGITDIRVIFIGSGNTRPNCEKYISDNGLSDHFEFRTEVMHDRLPDFYRGLDLFVLPSYWEAFGCVYTEAYASGVPFIGVKGQGIAELLGAEESDKWLIEKGDCLQLAQLIRRFMVDRSQRQNLLFPVDLNSLIKSYLSFIGNLINTRN